MQTKKDDMRERLLEAGLNSFLEYGYMNASVRKISRDAGTTLGNFYNYFESKLAMFDELVRYEYDAFMRFLRSHNDDYGGFEFEFKDLSSEKLIPLIEEFALTRLPPLTDRFLLLLARSAGTPYEEAPEQLRKLLKEHYLEHTKQLKWLKYDEAFAEILSRQFIDGMKNILETRSSEEERRRLMIKFFLYMFLGLADIMMRFPEV